MNYRAGGIKDGKPTEYLKYLEDKLERFISEPNLGCWIWLGSTNGVYGVLWDGDNYRQTYAHRKSWEHANRKTIPAGMEVRHSCDVPLCINPRHLSLGTSQENTRDSMVRNRATRPPRWQGSGHPRAKLTEAVVSEIRRKRADGFRLSDLCRSYSISEGALCNLLARRTWKHVE